MGLNTEPFACENLATAATDKLDPRYSGESSKMNSLSGIHSISSVVAVLVARGLALVL